MMDEPGNPDELCEVLNNWLKQVNDPIGTLPGDVTPTEWVVRNFIKYWRKPVRAGLDRVEEYLRQALKSLESGNVAQAMDEIEYTFQVIAEDVRQNLGLYDWNRETD